MRWTFSIANNEQWGTHYIQQREDNPCLSLLLVRHSFNGKMSWKWLCFFNVPSTDQEISLVIPVTSHCIMNTLFRSHFKCIQWPNACHTSTCALELKDSSLDAKLGDWSSYLMHALDQRSPPCCPDSQSFTKKQTVEARFELQQEPVGAELS